MKTYRSTRELLQEVDHQLKNNQPSFHHSPLEEVIEILCQGRHYTWMGIYLAAASQTKQLLGAGQDPHPGQVALPGTRSKILVSIKLAGREIGVLAVESNRENAFGSEDRVLLENVADVLARFLTGPGKYIVRKAHEQAGTTEANPQARGLRSESTAKATAMSVAVGEK